MKKINGKGFVLAEAIVVAVFVLGMFTYLAVNVIPLITKYEQALKYDNPQEVYAANILLDELVSYKNNYSYGTYADEIYIKSDSGNYVIEGIEKDYFKNLLESLNIKTIKLLTDKNCSGLNRNMTEYCKYLDDRKDLEELDLNDVILIEFKNNNLSYIKTKSAVV